MDEKYSSAILVICGGLTAGDPREAQSFLSNLKNEGITLSINFLVKALPHLGGQQHSQQSLETAAVVASLAVLKQSLFPSWTAADDEYQRDQKVEAYERFLSVVFNCVSVCGEILKVSDVSAGELLPPYNSAAHLLALILKKAMCLPASFVQDWAKSAAERFLKVLEDLCERVCAGGSEVRSRAQATLTLSMIIEEIGTTDKLSLLNMQHRHFFVLKDLLKGFMFEKLPTIILEQSSEILRVGDAATNDSSDSGLLLRCNFRLLISVLENDFTFRQTASSHMAALNSMEATRAFNAPAELGNFLLAHTQQFGDPARPETANRASPFWLALAIRDQIRKNQNCDKILDVVTTFIVRLSCIRITPSIKLEVRYSLRLSVCV